MRCRVGGRRSGRPSCQVPPKRVEVGRFSTMPALAKTDQFGTRRLTVKYQLGDCLAKRSAKRWFICTGSLGKNSSRVSPHNAGAGATIRTGTNFRENVGRLHAAHRALEVILALAGIEVLDG